MFDFEKYFLNHKIRVFKVQEIQAPIIPVVFSHSER